MTTHYLMSDQTLFRDCELFEFDYVPEIFNYRDAQLKDLAYAFHSPGRQAIILYQGFTIFGPLLS